MAYFLKKALPTKQKYPKLSAIMAANCMVVSGIIGDKECDDEGQCVVDNTAQGLVKRFEQLVAANPAEVEVRLRACYGGSIYEGQPLAMAMLEARKKGTKVITVCEGLAASMASFIFVHGEVRKIDRVSRVMIHRPKAMVYGDADTLQAEADNTRNLEVDIINRYAECCGQTPEFVKANWCDGPDHEFGADYCLANGIATEIIESEIVPPAASKIKGATAEMLASQYLKLMLSPKPTDKPTEMKHTEATKLLLGLPADATDEQVDNAIAEAKAAKAENETIKANAEKEMNAAIEAEVEEAVKANKILAADKPKTLEMAKKLGLADTKLMLSKMGTHTPISQQLGKNPAPQAGELEKLKSMTYDELTAANKLMDLKSLDESTFQQVYKDKFGKYYGDYKG